MQHHLEVMGEKVRETFAFTDFESLEIHGEPNDPLKEWTAREPGNRLHPPPGALGRLHTAPEGTSS